MSLRCEGEGPCKWPLSLCYTLLADIRAATSLCVWGALVYIYLESRALPLTLSLYLTLSASLAARELFTLARGAGKFSVLVCVYLSKHSSERVLTSTLSSNCRYTREERRLVCTYSYAEKLS